MTELLTLRNVLWLVTTSTEVILLLSLFWRKLQNTQTAFAIYVLSTIAQSGLAVFCYTHWGFNSTRTSTVVWGSQGVVISLRFLATFEMARRMLSGYQGLWALARRLLAAVALCTVAYSLLVAQKKVSLMVLNLDRGVELSDCHIRSGPAAVRALLHAAGEAMGPGTGHRFLPYIPASTLSMTRFLSTCTTVL